MLNFLGVLNSKGRLGLLREIIEAYDDLLEEQLGNVEVDVTVAQQLDAASSSSRSASASARRWAATRSSTSTSTSRSSAAWSSACRTS